MLVVDRKRRIEYKPEVFGSNSAHAELLLMDKTDQYEVYSCLLYTSDAADD